MLRIATPHRKASYALGLLLVAPGALADSANTPPHDGSPSQMGFLFTDYYRIDPAALEQPTEWISEYDLAVALHIMRHSDVELDQIVTWRRGGSSWDAITRRSGLSCEIYFVELEADRALPEPYARPYVTWDEKPGSDLHLNDVEIRELVLLRAMSDYCQTAAEEVVRLRVAGHAPRAIAAFHPPRRGNRRTSSASERLAPPHSVPSDPDKR